MAVFKRAGSPYWQIEFEYKGQSVRRTSGTVSMRKAQELEEQWRREIDSRGHVGRSVGMTLEDAVVRYFKTVVLPKGNSEAALRDYYQFDRTTRDLGAETPLTQLNAEALEGYRDRLLRQGLAPATVNRYLAGVRAVLNRARDEWGEIEQVPQIKPLKLENERPRWLSEDEEQRLIAACAPHLRDLVVFLLDTGARLSEATKLIWAHVDLDRQPRPMVTFVENSKSLPRGVPLTARVEDVLRRYRAANNPASEDRVFLYRPLGRGGRGAPIARPRPFRSPHGAWRTACVKAALNDVNLQDLRHTFARRLVTKGVPIPTVSQLLGHRSIQMAMRYAMPTPEGLDDAIEVLGR
ncbi:MAG: tyrosine-type recombinase/integrase [Candidatus Eiseniibacteriota bacterium]